MAPRVFSERAAALALAALVAATRPPGGGARTQASVQYVASEADNFFAVPGKSIYPRDAFALLAATDSCLCKVSCWVAITCVAWSFVTLADGSSQCRLADEGPTVLDVPRRSDATYYFKESAVPGVYSFKEDGLLYLTPSTPLPYEEAKAFCARIPGHRLGMFKTMQQLNMLEEYWCLPDNCPATLYMHLEKTADGVVFGDGTPLSSTEIAQAGITINAPDTYTFTFYNKMVDDNTATSPRPFLCQANPNGVDW